MMRHRIIPMIALGGLIGGAGCDAISSHTDVVARAGAHELQVDQVAAWLAENPRLPANADVVEAIANLWVDYILLADEASRDSMLTTLDLDLLLRPQIEQEIVWKLREEVIHVDEDLTDEELREQYDREQPGMTVRARHILIRVEPDAPAADRERAVQQLQELRARALAGEDFADLARQYSQDPGSAPEGGDLDFFGRGMMVQPFEDAAFALEVGEISDVVETPFGLHLIKVEEKQIQDFEEIKEDYRAWVIENRTIDAEDAYIEQLTAPMDIRVQDGAYAVVRELAANPESRLNSRAASRALVAYRDGSLDASEFLEFMRRASPAQRSQFAAATDEQIEPVLRGLTQNEILVAEATRRGLGLTDEEISNLREMTRGQVVAAATSAGLNPIRPQEGESVKDAIERQVATLMREIVRQERNVVALGPIAFTLRETHGATVYDRSFPVVVARASAPATGQ
ncbi:MAG TPA: peptidylprolyl isomerase [Longimicrobiales bacterium]|nr:peptidylprolyl isomerase [Longimicrobiales bacterium]